LRAVRAVSSAPISVSWDISVRPTTRRRIPFDDKAPPSLLNEFAAYRDE